jgi:hypothetical protein
MGGSIHLSPAHTWIAATWAVEAVAECTRRAIPEDNAAIAAAYEPLELLKDVVLDELGTDDFNCFLTATKQQFAACEAAGSCESVKAAYFDGLMKHWRLLISMLDADPRARRDQ